MFYLTVEGKFRKLDLILNVRRYKSIDWLSPDASDTSQFRYLWKFLCYQSILLYMTRRPTSVTYKVVSVAGMVRSNSVRGEKKLLGIWSPTFALGRRRRWREVTWWVRSFLTGVLHLSFVLVKKSTTDCWNSVCNLGHTLWAGFPWRFHRYSVVDWSDVHWSRYRGDWSNFFKFEFDDLCCSWLGFPDDVRLVCTTLRNCTEREKLDNDIRALKSERYNTFFYSLICSFTDYERLRYYFGLYSIIMRNYSHCGLRNVRYYTYTIN